MRALIVGADGFVGRWLLRHLVDSGDSVDAIVGPRFNSLLSGAGQVEQIDVRDAESLVRFVGATHPDAIFYLAGVSERGARDTLSAAAGVSVIGCLNILMAAAAVPRPPRLLYPSTGYVYASSEDPLTEQAPLRPVGLYAAGKLAAEKSLLLLGPLADVDILVARAFNHIGPMQSQAFLVPAVARQVAAAAAGQTSVVRIGPSTEVRDFCDVRDVVSAYRIMVLKGTPGTVYNVASGRGTDINGVVTMLIQLGGVSPAIESSPKADEGEQPPVLIGNAARLMDLGWEPKYELRETLAEVLAEHAQALAAGQS